MEAPETLLEFPCEFPIKAVGETREGLAAAVIETVLLHAPDFDTSTLETRTSSAGKYTSLTCTINATSKAQVDDLYRALTAHPMVKVVL
ncbi:MAG: YbeD family protein [Methylophilaceae bacterium]